MYTDKYGTDWDSLPEDEAIERAYAYGIAEVFADPPEGEYDRLRGEVTSAYGRSLFEHAYENGRRKALGRDPDDEGAVLDELLDEGPSSDLDPVETRDADDGDEDESTDSTSPTDRAELLDRPDRDSTEATERPDFLERD